MTRPVDAYRQLVDSGRLESDAAQRKAVAALTELHDALIAAPRPGALARKIRHWLGRRRRAVRGVYLWGGVGRGKTMLMDLFFDCLPFADKERAHFHRFMATVHAELKSLADEANPLERVADKIAERSRIVCFDEFAVTDIADAMILGTLFTALFERGVSLATTSNRKPEDLYRNGLQRQRFVPAIETLSANTHVIEVNGENDYRLRVLERADVFQCPADDEADGRLADYFAAIAPDTAAPAGAIDVLGRPIAHRGAADGVIWFDFDAVCDGPRSQDDYIELSRLYQTVLISGIPVFDSMLENQARRFIALVDEFYERRVKLIVSAAAPVTELYRGIKLEFEFDRTRSRLQEMQSHDYLSAEHLA